MEGMELFYELVQIAVGTKEGVLSRTPSEKEWYRLFEIAQKQAVVGMSFVALDKLATYGQKPPIALLYEWLGLSEQIKNQNQLLNRKCGEITKIFADAGFRTCILKGQGNAMKYPEPLLRTSGDIDVWVEGNRDDIRSFVVSKFPNAIDGDMHIEFPIFGDVPVEIHYKPRYSSVPKYENRLQTWFDEQANEQFSHTVILDGSDICVPTAKFNAIQQMSHMMGHFISEGIGMRHLLDYYYVLKQLHNEGVKENFISLFNHLGMLKFARGMMWIEKEILGLNEECLIVPTSENVGKIILVGMMDGGNFGFYRADNIERKSSIGKRGIIDAWRLLKIMPVQPSEVICRLGDKIFNVSSMKLAVKGI